MDVREKLVELICGFCSGLTVSDITPPYGYENLADFMISNGVTVQELDGCEYCSEDSDGYRKMIGAFSIKNPFHGNEWFIDTGHCKPRQIFFCPMCGRKLPQPPKGE